MLCVQGSISRSPAERKVLISENGAKTTMNNNLPTASIEAVTRGLASAGYIASQQIATRSEEHTSELQSPPV
jgi:hypothetical protein